MHQEEGLKFYLDIKNNIALPLYPAYLEHVNVESSAGLPYMRLTISGRVNNHVTLVVTS
jgi:hypothetical protein